LAVGEAVAETAEVGAEVGAGVGDDDRVGEVVGATVGAIVDGTPDAVADADVGNAEVLTPASVVVDDVTGPVASGVPVHPARVSAKPAATAIALTFSAFVTVPPSCRSSWSGQLAFAVGRARASYRSSHLGGVRWPRRERPTM